MKMNQNQYNGLLNLASKKLGTTPEKLQAQLENGVLKRPFQEWIKRPAKDVKKLYQIQRLQKKFCQHLRLRKFIKS